MDIKQVYAEKIKLHLNYHLVFCCFCISAAYAALSWPSSPC